MKTRLSKMLACLFAGILTATAADYSVFAATPSTLEYYVCPNTKILKENEDKYSGLTKNGKLLFSAAANERESGQIILTGSGTHTITLALNGDLSDGKGHSIPLENFEIYFEHYVYETEDINITDFGSYPDALIPYELAKDIGANKIEFGSVKAIDETVTVTKNNQGIWFTLTVPKGTPAGIYTGTLTGSLNVDVEVQVYDFELPDKTQSVEWLEVHAHSSLCSEISDATGIQESTQDAADQNIKYLEAMNKFLDKRKISSGHSGVVYDWISGKKLNDYVDGIYKYVSDPANKAPNKAPYYDIMVDTFTRIEAPITLKDGDQFIKDLEQGKDVFKWKNIDISNISSDLSELKALDLLEQKGLSDHINWVAKNLEMQLKKLAQEYFNLPDYFYIPEKNSPSQEEKCPPQFIAEHKNLRKVMKYFYAKYLIKTYGKDGKTLNTTEVQDLLSSVLEICGPYQNEITSPYYHYLFSPMNIIVASTADHNEKGLIGVTNIMKKIVDKSIEKDLDLLQYAFLKVPNIDEPPAWTLTDNLETLLNAAAFDKCKTQVREYIEKQTDGATKTSLLNSIDNIMFLFTTAPTDESTAYIYPMGREGTVYTAIQYNGLKYLEKIDQNYKSLLKIQVNSKGSEVYKVTDTMGNDLELPLDFCNKDYCTLFTDFSTDQLVKAQDYDTTREALANPDIRLWWYSCTSTRSAGIAGFRLNQNRGKIGSGKIITMDPLAVKRANKWQQFQMGIRGEHFWAVDDGFKKKDGNRNVSQWCIQGNENVLVYPIKQYLMNVNKMDESRATNIAKNHGYFMSTLRLENEAEANDDYDYLCLAKQLVDEYPEYHDRLNSIIQTLIEPGNVDYTNSNLTNPKNLVSARNQLAAFIEGKNSSFKRITNTNAYIKLSDYRIQSVSDWKDSKKALCFDVFKLDGDESGTASFILADDEFHALSDVIWINFYDKGIKNAEGSIIKDASLVSKGGGWYQVILPLGNAPANRDKDPNGKGTLSKLYFDSRNVTSPFLLDNLKVVTEIFHDWPNDYIKLFDYNVSNWKSSKKALCFDVFKLDGEESGTASFILVDKDSKNLSDVIWINFYDKVVKDASGRIINGASLVSKGDGWYQVILPLGNAPANRDKDPNGKGTLCKLYFASGNVTSPFLIDNVKLT